jgi:hypothetical protein
MLYLYAGCLVAGLVMGSAGAWKVQAWRHDAAELVRLEQVEKREKEWQQIVAEVNDVRESEKAAVAAERDRALAGLRNRPRERLQATPKACAGASPTALSEQDAGVVVRLAAEADQLRADYVACRQWVDAVTR